MKRRKKKHKTKHTHIVVSYVPLLYCQGSDLGQSYDLADKDTREQLKKRFNECSAIGNARACVWATKEDGNPMAIYAVPQAREVANHLHHWCQGDPTWFTIYLHYQEDKGYAMALMPDTARSIARFKRDYTVRTEEFLPKDTKFEVLYSPLAFYGKRNAEAYQVILDKLENLTELSLGLVECDVLKEKQTQLTQEDILLLGKFKLHRGDLTDNYLAQQLVRADILQRVNEKQGR